MDCIDNCCLDNAHTESRPAGDNGIAAEDFLRRLFREGFLGAFQFEDRLVQLIRLKAGDLKPVVPKDLE
jgi:hypothetical protein